MREQPPAKLGRQVVVMQTSMGAITLELDGDQAPVTVANFLKYVDSGHYKGTVFHRVIQTFMIQGGGFTRDLEEKPTQRAIQNEAGNGLRNLGGAIAMARTGDPHSATAQFFINTKDNRGLDRDQCEDGCGYTVFGKVTAGMDVVRKIAAVRTGAAGPFDKDCPLEPVVIESVTRQAPAAP